MGRQKRVHERAAIARQLCLSAYLLDKPEPAAHEALEDLLRLETSGTDAFRFLTGMLAILRDKETDVTELQVEYAKLFFGPFAMLAPPYAGLYLSGEKRMNGVVAREVAAIYAKNGLKKNPAHKILPDHIAAEWEFLYFLLYQYRKTGDPGYLRRYQDFYEAYVKSWCGRWLQDIETHARTEYYRLLAAYLRLLVRRAGMLYVA